MSDSVDTSLNERLASTVGAQSGRMASEQNNTLATPAAGASEGRLWSALREAVRGSHRNYTEGPIGRSVLLLAVPMVLEMSMESLFAVVDIFWVGNLALTRQRRWPH
jgi:hypothetical protein